MTGEYDEPYSGRLIFDHFPKTAGQAINRWLTDALGSGTVSPNLISTHRDLLSRGGTFPVLTGHIYFADGEGFDSRYRYATVLREPIDRTLSSVFFVTMNHDREDLPDLYDECEAFIISEGDVIGPQLKLSIVNPMVTHFAQILGEQGLAGDALVDRAFEAVESYACVGVYERLDDFVSGLGALIGIPAPTSLTRINATQSRAAATELSEKLRQKLRAITDLDAKLYERVCRLVEQRIAANPPAPPDKSRWKRYERAEPGAKEAPELTLRAIRMPTRAILQSGGVMRVELEFELHARIERLQVGFHIFDDQKRWAFGVNNLLLKQPFEALSAGRYCLAHTLTADLPIGKYTVGFSFAEIGAEEQRNLFWQDETLQFEVSMPVGAAGLGYSPCYTQMVLERIEEAPIDDPGIVIEAIA